MAATAEKVLENRTPEKKRLEELGQYLSKDWNTWISHSKSELNKEDFKEIVKWLKSLEKKNRITGEDFRAVLLLCLAFYVESHIEEGFEKVLGNKFSSVLASGTK